VNEGVKSIFLIKVFAGAGLDKESVCTCFFHDPCCDVRMNRVFRSVGCVRRIRRSILASPIEKPRVRAIRHSLTEVQLSKKFDGILQDSLVHYAAI
jgi:hypothetical protein